MEKKSQKQLEDNFIDQKLAEAFGYQDEQLAEELDTIAAEAGDDLLRAPGGELQKIMDRLEREEARRVSGRKVVRVRKMVKVLAAAAVLGTMVIGGSMWVGAKKYYTYDSRERSDLENVVVFNSNENNLTDENESEETESYGKIKEELNIEVFELSYLPESFSFLDLTLWKTKALMKYSDGNSRLFFIQGWSDKSDSVSYVSDMEEFKSVFNEYLDIEIPVCKKGLENGDIEYSIRIVKNNKYYLLHGDNIAEEEFCHIVREIRPYEQ